MKVWLEPCIACGGRGIVLVRGVKKTALDDAFDADDGFADFFGDSFFDSISHSMMGSFFGGGLGRGTVTAARQYQDRCPVCFGRKKMLLCDKKEKRKDKKSREKFHTQFNV